MCYILHIVLRKCIQIQVEILLYPTLYKKLCNIVFNLQRSKLFCYFANTILLGKAVLFGGIYYISKRSKASSYAC